MGRGSKAMQTAGSEQALLAFARLVKAARLQTFTYALGHVRKANQARAAAIRLRGHLGESAPVDEYGRPVIGWTGHGWTVWYLFRGKEALLTGTKG